MMCEALVVSSNCTNKQYKFEICHGAVGVIVQINVHEIVQTRVTSQSRAASSLTCQLFPASWQAQVDELTATQRHALAQQVAERVQVRVRVNNVVFYVYPAPACNPKPKALPTGRAWRKKSSPKNNTL